MTEECHLCSTPAPRLYMLPPKVRQVRPVTGAACYFCFIRATGIKPTRRQQVSLASLDGASATG
jgi:hypothetical protein